MRPCQLRTSLIVAAFLLSAAPGGAQRAPVTRFARADTAQLHNALEAIANSHHGIVGYAIHNLDTGERLARRGDETFPTASLIKVPVMVTVYDLVAKGQLSLDDPLTLLTIDKVEGSGVLHLLHNGLVITVRDAVALMIATSDNTATNLLLDRILIRRVWDKMEALGLRNTKVHHKVSTWASSVAPDSTKKYGLGVTTPNEMARLFELLALGKAVDARSDSAMLAMLDDNQDSYQMQRAISGVRAPHKTGSVNASRTECAIFFLQSRVVACALTKENVDQRWLFDNEGQVTLGRIGDAVVKAWPRKPSPAVARDPLSLVPAPADDSLELLKVIYSAAFSNGTGTAHSAAMHDVVCVSGLPPAVDPPAAVLAALQERRTLIVRQMSGCKTDPIRSTRDGSLVVDTLTGKRGISISVSDLKFTDDRNFTVSTGYYQHGLSAAGWSCTGRRTDDGRWEITKCSMRWIS